VFAKLLFHFIFHSEMRIYP